MLFRASQLEALHINPPLRQWCWFWSPCQGAFQLFLHWIVFFRLCNKQSVGSHFKNMLISSPSMKFPPRFQIHWWFLPEPIFTLMIANGDLTPVLPSHLPVTAQHSAENKNLPLYPPILLSSHPLSIIYHLCILGMDYSWILFSMVYNLLLSLLSLSGIPFFF